MDKPGPSSAASTSSTTPESTAQSLTGMRAPTNLSEWQLQAVLARAKLTQYFDTFISQGGDDIDQLMECDESEFLEIMSFVGMLSKPLHVRRLQRTLTEFSKNRLAFLQESIPLIGPPPLPNVPHVQADMAEALRVLLSHPLQTQFSRSQPFFANSPSTSASFRMPFSAISATSTSSLTVPPISLASLPAADILAMVSDTSIPISRSISTPLVSVGLPSSSTTCLAINSSQPSTSSTEAQPAPTLTESDMCKLKDVATTVLRTQPKTEPKITQRKPPKEVQLALLMSAENPERNVRFHQLSAIYGRSDTKRKLPKTLNHHELLINEAAAQICFQQPDYLTRRSELFALARQVSRLSGLQQHRIRDMDERARQLGGQSISPSIRSTPTPDEFVTTRSYTASLEPAEETSAEPSRAIKRRRDSSSPGIDPKKSK